MKQEAQVIGGKILTSSGKQTLEEVNGSIVVCDGWLTSWVIFYDHKAEWRHDGTLVINKPIQKYLDKLAKVHADQHEAERRIEREQNGR